MIIDRWISRGYTWVRNQDLLVLILMLGAALAAWAVIELADEVKEGTTRELDEKILLFFREPGNLSDPIGPPWVEEGMRDLTAIGGVTVLGLFVMSVSGYVLLRRQYHAFWLILAAIGGGLLLNLALKSWVARPRPTIVPHLSNVLTASFPSGHSMLSAVVYLTLAALLARLAVEVRFKLYIIAIAVLFSFLVGVSRVYLGVHYPTDVLAGWTLGLLWAVLCWLVARFLQKRGKVEKPGESAG